jgi:hypothetical protein
MLATGSYLLLDKLLSVSYIADNEQAFNLVAVGRILWHDQNRGTSNTWLIRFYGLGPAAKKG